MKFWLTISVSRINLNSPPKFHSRFRQLAGRDNESRSGFTTWDMGDLPERVGIKNGDHSFFGYPAVIDEGDSVGIRNFETEIEAKIHHRRGLIRLFHIGLSKDVKYLIKNLKVPSACKKNYEQLETHPFLYPSKKIQALEDALATVVLATVFIEGQSEIRSEDAFRKRLKDFQPGLITTANQACEMLSEILADYFSIKKKLNTGIPKHLIDDVSEQLGVLIYQGFLIQAESLLAVF